MSGFWFFKTLIWKNTSKNECSIKVSSMRLFLMKTSTTKDIPYNRHALKHKTKFFLELSLIPLTSFPITIIYNFPAAVILALFLPGLTLCILRRTSL